MKPPFDFREHFTEGNHRFADLGAWLERGQVTETTLRWGGEPRGWRRFIPADLRDLWTDVAAEPGSHLIAALTGLAAGGFGTLGLAFLWSLFL